MTIRKRIRDASVMLPSNGLELSCPAARATAHAFSRNSASKARPKFPPASRVSCSEWLCDCLLDSSSICEHGRHVS